MQVKGKINIWVPVQVVVCSTSPSRRWWKPFLCVQKCGDQICAKLYCSFCIFLLYFYFIHYFIIFYSFIYLFYLSVYLFIYCMKFLMVLWVVWIICDWFSVCQEVHAAYHGTGSCSAIIYFVVWNCLLPYLICVWSILRYLYFAFSCVITIYVKRTTLWWHT